MATFAPGSTYFDKKGEVNELRQLLRSVSMEKDNSKKRDVMKKVIAYMTLGIDVSRLFGDMVMASATTDLVQKKMIYLYLANYAECNQELAILAVNTLQKDCRDDDPMIRGLALRSLCSLRLQNMLEYLEPAIKTGLQDKSGYVRKTAVVGTLKLYHIAPAVVREGDFCDTLYRLVNDVDVHVVQNAIIALEEILEFDNGMVLTKNVITGLLNRIMQFSEWGQCVVLKILSRYEVGSEQEMWDIMNILDSILKQSSASAAVATSNVFLRITAKMNKEGMMEQVSERLKPVLLTLAATSTPELAYTILVHVQLLLQAHPVIAPMIWGADFKQFFCRYNDPSYVKAVKLDILTLVVREDTIQPIVAEMSEYVTDVDTEIARASIRAIGAIALKCRTYSEHIFESLLQLLTLDIDYVSAEAMVVMKDLLRKYPDHFTRVGSDVMEKCVALVTEQEGRCSILWILGEYGHHIENAPYLLEPMVDTYNEEESIPVKLMLLTTAVKLFFKRPPEMVKILGRMLHSAIESSHPDVKDRALLYYRLLHYNVDDARRVIVGGREQEGGMEFDDDVHAEDVDRLFKEFDTLSIIYKLPPHKFIQERRPLYTGPMPTGPNIPTADEKVEYKGNEDEGGDGSVGVYDAHEQEQVYNGHHQQEVAVATAALPTAAAPTAAPPAPHADLLGDLFGDPAPANSSFDPLPVGLELDAGAKVDSGHFQQSWGRIENPQIQVRPLRANVPLTADELQRIFLDHRFFCVASGQLPSGELKFYLYARARQSEEFFFEIIINPGQDAKVTLKSESPEAPVMDIIWKTLGRFI